MLIHIISVPNACMLRQQARKKHTQIFGKRKSARERERATETARVRESLLLVITFVGKQTCI